MQNANSIDSASSSSKPNASDPQDGTTIMDRFQARHVFAIMGFLGFANVYAMRVNLSVAIVAMVNSSFIPQQNSSSDTCPDSEPDSADSVKEGTFEWDEATQGIILGSFFWGYIVTNPIGGRLGDVLGGKRVFCFGVFVTSLLTLLTPWASRMSPYMLTALRVCIGLGEGVTFPAMNSMMSRWIPPLERSQTSSLVFAGSQIGIVISYPLSGLMCKSSLLEGWPLVFYVFGALGLVWCALWMAIIHDSPSNHPRISAQEKEFILSRLKSSRNRPKSLRVPFKAILSSLPFWAILVSHVSQNWGYYFLLTELPTYMKNILHLRIGANSVFSALPYLMMWLFGLVTGFVADYLRRRDALSTTSTRRICNTIGCFGPMVCLALVGYSGCNTRATLALLTLGVGLNGATYAGYMNSHLDIADNYAGTLMGITNCVATVPGFVAPMMVGRLISGQETLSQWRLVFWIAAIVYLVGNTFYVIFISGEEQPWNTWHFKGDENDEGESDTLLDAEAEEEESYNKES